MGCRRALAVAVAWSSACGAAAPAPCRPPPATLWLVAVFHKTGTQLNRRIFEDVAASGGGAVGYLDHRRDYAILTDPPWSRRGAALEAAPPRERRRVCASRVLFASEFPVGGRADLAASAARLTATFDARCGFAANATRRVRVVEWLRAPLPLVLSAYFYHKTSNERWLHLAPAGAVEKWGATCAAPPRAPADLDFRARACGRASDLSNASVAAALGALPPRAGALLAAHMALWTLGEMNKTAAAARAVADAGDDALGLAVAFLDFDDFNATFARVFAGLGVPRWATDACVALAAPHDLAAHPPPHKTHHVHRPEDDALRDDLATFLVDTTWWRTVVAPFDALLHGE